MSYSDMEYAEVNLFVEKDIRSLLDVALNHQEFGAVLWMFLVDDIYSGNFSKFDSKSYNKVNVDVDRINHCFVHIIPRKANDMKKNDDLYPLFEAYDKEYLS